MTGTSVPGTGIKLTPGQRWGILTLLCVAFMIAYFDRQNLSVAVAAKEFKEYFNLSDMDRGSLNAAFFWSYAALQIPAGWVVDRYGVKWPFAIGFFCWSLVSAATAYATSVSQIIGLRLLLGVGEAVNTPAGMTWIRQHYKEEERGFAVGIYMAAAKVGPAMGAPLSAWLLIEYGWQNMFLIMGLGCMIWLVPWVLMVKEAPRAAAMPAQSAEPAISFWRVTASPIIWGTFIGTFCYQYFVYFCLTWLPAYFAERRGFSLKDSSYFTGFSFLGMAIVATAAGYAADRIIARGGNPVKVRKAFIIAGFLVAMTEMIGATSNSRDVAVFFSIFSLSGLGLMTANYWALTQTMIPGAAVGRIVGIQNMAANLPGVVAPLLTAWLKEKTGSFEAPMYAIWVFLFLGIASYVFLVREKYAPTRS